MRALLALVLVLAAAPAAAQREPEWRTAPEYDVLLRPFAYEPPTIRLEAGRPVRLRFVNGGQATHSFQAPRFFRAARLRRGDEDLALDRPLPARPRRAADDRAGSGARPLSGQQLQFRPARARHAGDDHRRIRGSEMAKAKTKVPKRVGGVKVPKKVRKQAKKALKLVDAPVVRDFAIAGLTAAAEALVQRTSSQLRAAGDRQRKATLDALDLGDMLRAAAIEGARRFVEGFEETRRAPSAAKRRARRDRHRRRRPRKTVTAAQAQKAAAKPAAAKRAGAQGQAGAARRRRKRASLLPGLAGRGGAPAAARE